MRPNLRKQSSLPNSAHYKILVVEDDLPLCEMLEYVFESTGYGFQIFNDTEEIMPLVDNYQPDLILIDYLLPSNNGGELCGQVKNNCLTAHIPVIIYSAINKQLLPLDEYRCDVFIEKPFDLNVLTRQMASLLKKTARSPKVEN